VRVLAALSLLVASMTCGAAGDAFGADPASAREHPPARWALRVAGGVALPLGDLANDDPGAGWVGGQGTGYALQAGVRIPLMRDVLVRPELSLYGFGDHHDPALPVLVFDGSGGPPDTVSGDWTRRTLMAGLRVHLDYVPEDRRFVSPFLTGGLGLVFMRLEDEFLLPGYENVGLEEETLGLSASIGVGLLVGALEIVAAGTFQEPGFTDFGSVSWFTADISVGYSIPIAG
jgi:hypothetical protein